MGVLGIVSFSIMTLTRRVEKVDFASFISLLNSKSIDNKYFSNTGATIETLVLTFANCKNKAEKLGL